MAQNNQQQIPQGESQQQVQNPHEQQELSEADKQVYEQIFQSLSKINKKVQTAKNKMQNNQQSARKQEQNMSFKQIAQKLIQSKQNSQIVNKEDLLTDINQSYERAVIDVYSDNQKLKKKQLQMQKIIKQQNHKMFQQQSKEQDLIKQIQKLKFQLAQHKDQKLMVNRNLTVNNTGDQKEVSKKIGTNKIQSNQNNQDYDFWNSPQNDNNAKRKKQFVENSGLWVNQKNMGESAFLTQGKR